MCTTMVDVFDVPVVSRLKASKCDVASPSAKLKVWLAAKGHYDLQLIMQPMERWAHSRAMPTAKDMIAYIDLAKIVYTLSPNLKPCHRDMYDALLELHSKHDLLPGVNAFCSARKYSGLIRKPLEWYRAVAFYKDKRDLVFKDASESQICIITSVTELLTRPVCTTLAIAPSGPRKQRSCSSLCSSVDMDMDMGMALDELSSLGGATRPQTSAFDEAAALCDELSSLGGDTRPQTSSFPMVAMGGAPGSRATAARSANASDMAKLCDELGAFGDDMHELAPLPGGVGALQRSLTTAVKKTKAETAAAPVKAGSPHTPVKATAPVKAAHVKAAATSSKASPKSVAKHKSPAQIAAYERKKRKSRAWHRAVSAALAEGKSVERAQYAGRYASDITE